MGEQLLTDVSARSASTPRLAGWGLFVDVRDEPAAGFYLNFGFAASPDNPLLLLTAAVIGK